MIRGFYAAVSGMVANLTRAQIVSNNLANLGTVGYKEDVNIFRSFRQLLINRLEDDRSTAIGQLGTGTEISPVVLKLDQGSLRATGNNLDIAIEGPGFFALQTPGGIAYTRTGHLYRDLAGQLVTADGTLVLGQAGPVVLPQGDVQFGPDGSISVNGALVDQLQLAEFTDPQRLRKLGQNRYGTDEVPTPAIASQLRGGFLEESNVDPTRNVVDLITVQRAYEAGQLISGLHDQMTGKAVNEVGRVG